MGGRASQEPNVFPGSSRAQSKLHPSMSKLVTLSLSKGEGAVYLSATTRLAPM